MAPAGPIRAARRLAIAGALVTAGAGAAGALPAQAVLLPLAGALLLTLPHGAVDHLVIAGRLSGRTGRVLGTAGYAAVAVAAHAVLELAPVPAFAAFLIASVLHFGTADREHVAAVADRPGRAWTVAVGALPVAALLVRPPPAVREVAAAVDPSLLLLLERPAAVAVGVAAVAVAAVAVEARRGHRAALADLGVLAALVVAAPAMWAFAAYLGLWHAPRHLARILVVEQPWATIRRHRGTGAAAARFLRDAAAPTVLAIAAGAALAVGGARSGPAVAAVALQVTVALTAPHALTVAWLDARDRRAPPRTRPGAAERPHPVLAREG